MRKPFLLFLMALISVGIKAQYTLEVEDITNDADIYSSRDSETLVVVRCHKDIPLKSFYTQLDYEIDPIWTELEGTDSIYNLELPTGKEWNGRILRITADGYYNTVIQLGDLEPKRIYTFQLRDPDALVDAGCYREHRNKGMEEMRNIRYDEARAQFIVARECSDVDKVENELNIAKVDSILSYQRQALVATELLDYLKAADYYNKIYLTNPYDKYAEEKRTESLEKYRYDCDIYFKQAESYYNDKEYAKAEQLYQKIITNGCPESAMANSRILKIADLTKLKKQHARVFTYEYMKDMPIGIHYGKYKMRRTGGFINLNLSGNVFKFAKGDLHYNSTTNSRNPKQDFPEMNINFGWTVKIANPVWIYFGPGASAKCYFGHYEEIKEGANVLPETYPTSKEAVANKDFDSSKINVAVAVSPTVGITVKYSWFAIRLGYEYRYCIKRQLRDFMGEHRLTLGAGIAF